MNRNKKRNRLSVKRQAVKVFVGILHEMGQFATDDAYYAVKDFLQERGRMSANLIEEVCETGYDQFYEEFYRTGDTWPRFEGFEE